MIELEKGMKSSEWKRDKEAISRARERARRAGDHATVKGLDNYVRHGDWTQEQAVAGLMQQEQHEHREA